MNETVPEWAKDAFVRRAEEASVAYKLKEVMKSPTAMVAVGLGGLYLAGIPNPLARRQARLMNQQLQNNIAQAAQRAARQARQRIARGGG